MYTLYLCSGLCSTSKHAYTGSNIWFVQDAVWLLVIIKVDTLMSVSATSSMPCFLAPSLWLCQIWLHNKRGTIKSSMHLTTETAPSLLLMIFLDVSFSSVCIRSTLTAFPSSARNIGSKSIGSHTQLESPDKVPFQCGHMLGEPSSADICIL